MPCRSRLSLLGRGASKWLIIPAVGNNKLRHERLRHFMLANDSVTVAIEIPIWLTEADITALEGGHEILAPRNHPAERAITGHIDFSKMRNGAVHILDYKPDARTNRRIAQLAIYARALTRRVPASSRSISSAPGSTRKSTARCFLGRSCGAWSAGPQDRKKFLRRPARSNSRVHIDQPSSD